jgi:hypothetical protein
MTTKTLDVKDDQNPLPRLESWYRSMCNGDWEHTYGIKIETLDNPGWMVTIEVRDTPLSDLPFQAIRVEVSETEWIQCEVVDGVFCGTGGLGGLNMILSKFLDWAEANH